MSKTNQMPIIIIIDLSYLTNYDTFPTFLQLLLTIRHGILLKANDGNALVYDNYLSHQRKSYLKGL